MQTNTPTFIKDVKVKCYITFSKNSIKYCNDGVFLETYYITEVNYYRKTII